MTRALTEKVAWLRALRDPTMGRFWLAHLLEQVGEWVFLVALIATAWAATDDVHVEFVATVLLARFAPRAIVLALGARVASRMGRRTYITAIAGRAVAAAALILVVPGPVVLEQLMVGAVAFGLLSAAAVESHAAVIPSLVPRSGLGEAAQTDTMLERAAFTAGPVIAAITLYLASSIRGPAYHVTFMVAAVALGVSAVLAPAALGSAPDRPADDGGRGLRGIDRRSILLMGSALGSGAIAGSLMIGLVTVAVGPAPAMFGLLLAALGAGTVIGPLPVVRLKQRAPWPVLLVVAVGVIAVLAALATAVGRQAFEVAPLIVIPGLVVIGVIAVTIDSTRATAARRLAPDDTFLATTRGILLAGVLGQVAAVAFVGAMARVWGVDGAVLGVAVLAVGIVALSFLLAGPRDLLAGLPPIHPISWRTNPATRSAGLSDATGRQARLSGWIERRADLETLDVTLPISGRRFSIHKPTDVARERLFEEGRKDPDKQMPYWAKTWPSGVALADVAVERADELRGREVVELGAGLGVTACAILQAGARLTTADYGMLSLALCRLNTLDNVGLAAHSLCFNWRDPSTPDVLRRQVPEGFPLVLAADVLYEFRDVDPMLELIERLVTADGSLWMAEPARRTSQRFLDAAAAMGWQGVSRTVYADWPDDTSDRVDIHLISRSRHLDRLAADLGGWRI